jgi:hypothetical protein
VTWTSHPHRIDDPSALAWRGDGRAIAVAGHERVELLELDRIGATRIDTRFDGISGVCFEGAELRVSDGERWRRFDRSGALLGTEVDRGAPPPPTFPGFAAGEISGAVRSASRRSALASTARGVFLIRDGAEPRWLADGGAIGFAGERPIVSDRVHDAAGDPRRVLRAGGTNLAPAAIAAAPGGAIAFACPGVVHVAAPRDLGGADPLPGLAEPATDLAVCGDYLAAVSPYEVVVFDRRTAEIAARWQLGAGYNTRVAFIDPETLLIGYHGVDVWRWRPRRWIDRWASDGRGAVEWLVCERGRVLIAGPHHLEVRSNGGEPLWSRGFDDDWIRGAALHPTEPRLAVAFEDGPALVLGDDGVELAKLSRCNRVALSGARLWISDHDAGRSLAWPPAGEASASFEPFALSAPVEGGVVTGGDAGVVRFSEAGEVRWAALYRDGVRALAADRAGPSFCTAGRSPWIAERHLADGALTRVLPAGAGAEITCLALSPAGDHLVAGDESGRIAVWAIGEPCRRVGLADASDLAVSERFEPGAFGRVVAVALGPELVALGDGVLRWRGPLIGDIGAREPDRRDIEADCLSRDGAVVAATPWDRPIEILSVRNAEVLARIPAPDEIYGSSLALSDRGERLLVADEGSASVWSIAGGALVGRLDVDREISGAALVGGDVALWIDRLHTAVGRPGLLVRWDPERSRVARWIDAPVELGDARGLVAAGDRALLWSDELSFLIDGAQIAAVLPPHRESVTAAALSPAGIAATGDRSGVIRVWDPAGRLRAELCTTADGSWWRSVAGFGSDDFHWEPSANLKEGRW